MDNPPARNARRAILLSVVLLVCVVGLLFFQNWPAIGSKMATPMRRLLGVARVAQIETILFNLQDRINRWKYDSGLVKPEVPWSAAQGPAVPGAASAPNPSATLSEQAASAPGSPVPSPTPVPANSSDSSAGEPTPTPGEPSIKVTITPTPSPSVWTLPNIKPFGALAGEGVWQPYIQNPDGEVLALRTFLQPDRDRPYAVVAVAAFNLQKTELHFILGTVEPSKPGGPHGTGIIPPEDKQPGKLLAAFNGGFIAEHGQYGAMAGGVMPLPARPGLATLAIFPNGDVRLGEWGKDLSETEKYIAWRQNAIMIIHNGEINPKVTTGTWEDWGANYDFNAVTLRSSIGLSQDNQVLYYFAGPSLLMPPLAEAMAAAGAYNGMLLDINPTHAHFTAIRVVDGEMTAEPLFKEEMNVWVDRYIRSWPYEQDFFYITIKG